jgi:hypothetical protein
MKKLLLFFTLFFCSHESNSAIIYVNVNAVGMNNGSSWVNAYNDLQTALSVAFVNDDIWVAAGTYKPTSTSSRGISFVMKNGVDLYGGFNGTETAISQRNIATNPTILSGDIGALGSNTDNTYRVVKIENLTAPLTFDGFQIVSGYNENATSNGSGMMVANNSSLIQIKNTIIYNNYANTSGAGLYVESSTVDFYFTEFLYNSTSVSGTGGAIYADIGSPSNLHFYDSKFIGNFARNGVVVMFRSSGEFTFDRVLVTSNSTSTLPSAVSIMTFESQAYLLSINNSLIAGNTIHTSSGTILDSNIPNANSASLTNVTICHNKNTFVNPSTREPVFHSGLFGTQMNIKNCIIYGNSPSDLNAQVNAGSNLISHSIIENGYAGGTVISTSNPLFVNPSTLAAAPFDASLFDYSLQSLSPAVNFGNNTFALPFSVDYANNTRIQQGIVDCGALESPFTDGVFPSANCSNITLALNASGIVIIDSSDVDNGSSDNIGIVNATISESTFDCSDIGTQTLTFIVTDAAGNADTCYAQVTVLDNLPPVIVAQNGVVYLDGTGNANVDVNDLNLSTSDNCGLDTLFLSQYNFDCSDVGNNSIVFTAIDIHGNSSSQTLTVMVIDSVLPTAISQDAIVYLDANGNATLNASLINDGSFDDCGIASLQVAPSSFNCSTMGNQQVILTATDFYGNEDADTANVTVLDTISPTTVGQDITVNLATMNPYIITANDLDVASDDNCSFTQTIDVSTFNAPGVYDVVLTSIDASGNSSSATYQVTVINSTIGIVESDKQVFLVSPNPTHGELEVHFKSKQSSIHIQLYDLSGKLIHEERYLETDHLNIVFDGESGSYILEITTANGDKYQTKVLKR